MEGGTLHGMSRQPCARATSSIAADVSCLVMNDPMEYQFESLGPALRLVVLAFLFVFALLALAVVVLVAALPGKIARSRQHPQYEAINICGWVGLPTGILWAIALVWAYSIQPARGDAASVPNGTVDELSRQIDLLEQAVETLELDSGKAKQ